MRAWLRRRPLWVDFQRWRREGFLTAFRRWRLWRRILRTPPVPTAAKGGTELHLLCYRNDYLCAIWALKTFYRFAGSNLPLWIHIQGAAPPRVARRLKQHFPDAHVITQQEADALVVPTLRAAGWSHLLTARKANHYMLKLTDFILLGEAPNLLTLDSDVLFFRQPERFLETPEGHLFQCDPASTYVLTEEFARETWGIRIAPRVNVGMMHFRRQSVSLARCNRYLERFPTFTGWLEQTLYALHAGECGNAEFLPASYLISLSEGIDCGALTARHYAGPSRSLMHREGIPYLIRTGFLSPPGGMLSS